MRRRPSGRGFASVVLLLPVAAWLPVVVAQQPSFRAETSMVVVGVSVKRGNTPVTGLGADDFVLFDSGVRQRVSTVSLDAMPIDVTLLMDTSGSTAGALSEMQDSVRRIAAMLAPADRFRLLTIGHSVYEAVPWTPAGSGVTFGDAYPVSGISLVYDALFAAVLHDVAPGRRHLVVVLSDGDDACSLVRPRQLRTLVGRTEAVVHWVPLQMPGSGPQGAAVCNGQPDADIRVIDALVEGSGGQKHTGLLGANRSPVAAFTRVLDDYRRSYVLYFVPEGVPRSGWHDLKVEVPAGRYTIRARSGYFSGAGAVPAR